MPIVVTCVCGNRFEARDEAVGQRTGCPACGRELVVPKGASDFDDPLLPGYLGAQPGTSGKAITSLVLGILSFICLFFTGLPAIIFGAIGLSDIGKSHGRLGGKGMAISGIVLGIIGSCFSVVIAVLIALLLPAVQSARAAAQRSQCVNNLKQISLAFANFQDAEGHYPTAAIADAGGKPLLSWRVAILPYLGEDALYKQFKLDEPWDSPSNQALAFRMPQIYRCPSDAASPGGQTHYQVIAGAGTAFDGPQGAKPPEITDGTSNTIFVAEAKREVPWTRPEDVDVDAIDGALGSKHPGGFNAAFADGSVKFIKITMPSVVLRALATKAGGELISTDSY